MNILAPTRRDCDGRRHCERGVANLVVLFVLLVLVTSMALGSHLIATGAIANASLALARDRALLNAKSGCVMVRADLRRVLIARLTDPIERASRPRSGFDLTTDFLADIDLPDYVTDPRPIQDPSLDPALDVVATRTRVTLLAPPDRPVFSEDGTAWNGGGMDTNGPHDTLYWFGYRTEATGQSRMGARARVVESGYVPVWIRVNSQVGETFAAGAAGGLGGGLGDLSGVDADAPIAVGAPDTFGPPRVMSMRRVGGSGQRVYLYYIKGLTRGTKVTAKWRHAGGGGTLRARVVLSDDWRRAANYDAGRDQLHTSAGWWTPVPAVGLVAVEGPPASFFFDPDMSSATGMEMAACRFREVDYFEPGSNIEITVSVPNGGSITIDNNSPRSLTFDPMENKPNVVKLPDQFGDQWWATTFFTGAVVNGSFQNVARIVRWQGQEGHPEYMSAVDGTTYRASLTNIRSRGTNRQIRVTYGGTLLPREPVEYSQSSKQWEATTIGQLGQGRWLGILVNNFVGTTTWTVRGEAGGVLDTAWVGETQTENANLASISTASAGGVGGLRPPTHLVVQAAAMAVVPTALLHVPIDE
jgi:hypothetical protein